MASSAASLMTPPKQYSVAAAAALSLLLLQMMITPCFSVHDHRRLDDYDPSTVTSWTPGTASWYGNPYGYGTDGGACGYRDALGSAPFNSLVTSAGPSIYKDGRGCGACYQIRCTCHELCSGNPVTVVITDSCPGCTEGAAFFDMAGTAFAALGRAFVGDQFRNLGRVPVEYRRVPCKYHDMKVTFRVDQGSNPYYLAVLVMYEAGDGDLSLLEVIPQPGSGIYYPMQPSWGAVWKYQAGDSPMPGPFTFRLTTGSGRTLVADNAIPCGWQPGNTYTSTTNFNPSDN